MKEFPVLESVSGTRVAEPPPAASTWGKRSARRIPYSACERATASAATLRSRLFERASEITFRSDSFAKKSAQGRSAADAPPAPVAAWPYASPVGHAPGTGDAGRSYLGAIVAQPERTSRDREARTIARFMSSVLRGRWDRGRRVGRRPGLRGGHLLSYGEEAPHHEEEDR